MFQSIAESLWLGIIAFDQNMRITWLNKRAGELIAPGEYIDRSLAAGTDRMAWQDWSGLLAAAIRSDRYATFPSVSYNHCGKKRPLDITCTRFCDALTGRLLGGIAVLDDITSRCNFESEMGRSERLASTGQFAARIAHELSNPLDGVRRYVNLAVRVLEKNDTARAMEYMSSCQVGLARVIQVLNELLGFPRSGNTAFDYAHIDRIVCDAVDAMKPVAGETVISLVRNCPPLTPSFRIGGLFEVFCNLIKNAADAVDGKGRLTITTSRQDDTVCVQFEDNGCGFDPNCAEVMFEPFFTTKPHGKGTGLGLSICRDIIEKYGGRITAQNIPQGGAVFSVFLPVTRQTFQPTAIEAGSRAGS